MSRVRRSIRRAPAPRFLYFFDYALSELVLFLLVVLVVLVLVMLVVKAKIDEKMDGRRMEDGEKKG